MSDWLTHHLKSPVPSPRTLPGEDLRRLLIDGANDLGLPLSPDQVVRLLTYHSELTRWNAKIDLTGLRDSREILIRLFLESLSLLKALGDAPGALLNLGSGAGFPGLAMKIARPALKITLVEADGKRVSFLHQIIGLLRLTGVPVHRSPFEQLSGPAWEEQFDFLCARSLSPDLILDKGRRFLRLGGRMLFLQTGANDPDWKNRLESHPGMELEKIEPVKLSLNPEARSVVFVKQAALPPKAEAPPPPAPPEPPAPPAEEGG